MTGALVEDIWKAGTYSASVAPNPMLSVIYCLLGILAAMAYTLGSCFPLRPRRIRQDLCLLTSIRSQAHNAMPSSLFVVIPALIRTPEEAHELQLAINKLSTLSDHQKIVVDDASPVMLTLIGCKIVRHARNLGPAAARNTGIKLALEDGATSIAFTDADCLPADDWASAHESLQVSSPGIWAGRTLAYDNNLVSQYCNDVGTLMPRLIRDVPPHEAVYAPTCNLSISRSIASRIAFDSEFPTSAFEDCDFCVRARDLGYTIRVSRKAGVRHRFKGPVGLVLSYFKYGRSFPLMLKKHPKYKFMLGSSHPMSSGAWKTVE